MRKWILGLVLAACAARPSSAPPAPAAPDHVIPAFIDSHVHLAFYPVGAELHARGIGAVVDLGGPIASLGAAAPLPLLRSGPLLTSEGGYPLDSWGKDGYGLGCATAVAATAAVDRLHAAGARVVKVVVFGPRGLDDAALTAAVTRAHALGLKVAAHALRAEDVRRAADAGVDVLAHTPTERLPDDLVAAWKGRAVVSTLAAFGGKPDTVDNLRRLRAAGAVVLYGTDLGNTRTAGIDPEEIKLLGAAGLDGAAIIEAATAAPARTWGLADTGRVLHYDADPRAHPELLSRPRMARQDAVAAGRGRMARALAEDKVPGMAIAVVIGDEVVWSEGFGLADRDGKRAVAPDTRFRLASVSKLVTVAVLARLVDAGKLDLDAPAGVALPSLPEPLRAVTARQLAGHLAGVRHYGAKELFGGARGPYATVSDSLGIFVDDPLVAPPGTRYAYSSYGYVLLSALLEKAGGEPFLALVGREVAGPLALASLGPDDGAPDLLRTVYYAPTDRDPVVAAAQDQTSKWAAGGLRASAVDVARLVAAHRAPGYLQASTLALLFTAQKTSDGQETGVGIGWRVAVDTEGRRYVHHAGNMAGSRALALLYPEHGVAVAILSNLSGTPEKIEALALEIATPFL